MSKRTKKAEEVCLVRTGKRREARNKKGSNTSTASQQPHPPKKTFRFSESIRIIVLAATS